MNDETVALADLRVLIVDDNIDAATSLSYLLQIIGCKTAVAFGGEMGMRVAELFQPVLLLIDLNMPGMDGCELLARIRTLPGRPASAMAVCLSATSQAGDDDRCRGAGFDHFAAKPLEPQALSELLLLARARQESANTGWWPPSIDAARP